MVYRVFVEKKPGLDHEAATLLADLSALPELSGLRAVRLFNRYDIEDIDPALFARAIATVFSEPPVDTVSREIDTAGAAAFAVEYLPGQFDQRADSAAQCIQIISQGERPRLRTARVYLLYGDIGPAGLAAAKKYVINPVDAREASMELPDTLRIPFVRPTQVETLSGFCTMTDDDLAAFAARYGLAMDRDDLAVCRDYFRSERRDPTITELRVIDTYWSDHCRHTTFLTVIDDVHFEDPLLEKTYADYLAARQSVGRTKPVTLMDIGTLAARCLRAAGRLDKLDASDEINACTVKTDVTVNGKTEPWLLLFKNETHNHPTEIEPFGGAATCIGGAIRDPLSGRAYVYAAMRVTGAADPTRPPEETMPGKLPQRKIVTTAAAGYSSYGNQIGLATGLVDEVYHPGYAAKRMEIGAVIAAVPAANVRREVPSPGDVVILLGGRTGRDGCGGATGSSKSHTVHSLENCGAEVQKGNAPEERKLQRLFRDPRAARMIKRCNDFGAGGVSVAIGELAPGLDIDLDAVPRKYEGLDGTELAISESQERMAVVVAPADRDAFIALAHAENLEATVVAVVKEEARMTMHWNGRVIADLSRAFLDSSGAEKHVTIETGRADPVALPVLPDFTSGYLACVSDLNICSKRGLAERFDATIGAGTVLMPFGGRCQETPIQAMVHKISVENGDTDTVSLMAYGYDPVLSSASPYHGAYMAVVSSVCKLIAAGAEFSDVYLAFQEYFARPGKDPARWGAPLSALLGAFRAQMDLGVAAIGGKDSMSGTFEKLDVPPTLVSFAVTTDRADHIVSPECKAAGDRMVLLAPDYDDRGLPVPASLLGLFARVTALLRSGQARACYTTGIGGVAEAVFKMAIGNGFGFSFDDALSRADIFAARHGAFVLELAPDAPAVGRPLGRITEERAFTWRDECIPAARLCEAYDGKLASVYVAKTPKSGKPIEAFSFAGHSLAAPAVRMARPRVLIPVFPGTNCEYDSAAAVREGGGDAEIFVLNNLTPAAVAHSVEDFAARVRQAQVVFIPGGFSGGDEPDGSGKFITAFFRSDPVREAVSDLLDRRDGLMLGICNGFQALIKLGLVPYGRITETAPTDPTLTFNTIGRHQSRIVRTRVASVHSPWLAHCEVGEIYSVPISHGEGRFLATDEQVRALAAAGQIATQYVDDAGHPTDDILFNPNGSIAAVEGILSPDGRVFGKMGHAERIGPHLYKNVPGVYDMHLFASAAAYFKQN